MLTETDNDFAQSGLRYKSLIRVTRLAVIDDAILPGSIGAIGHERLKRIKSKLAEWFGT